MGVTEADEKPSFLPTLDFLLVPIITLHPVRRSCLLISIAFSLLALLSLLRYADAHPMAFREIPISSGQAFALLTAMVVVTFAATRAIAARIPSLSQGGGPVEGWLTGAAEMSVYMIFFFACDRTTMVTPGPKTPSRDAFWFTCLLVLITSMFTLRSARAPPPPTAADAVANAEAGESAHSRVATTFHVKPLQRDQTEEWKGWMQLMFLWYHYFHEVEIYNAIRLYIAAYVWMTGFGNFSYYYVRRDFSVARFFAMQWRLNFLVLWVCLVLGNEYMLYYICMLHTTFTVMIYAGLGIFSSKNYTNRGIFTKFAILTAISAFIWDIPGVFEWVWAPVTWLVQYHDPYSPQRPILSEWKFRSWLDHYVWVIGMLCAYMHPRCDAWLAALDALPRPRQFAIKAGIVLSTIGVMYVYTTNVFLLPKREYNALHPYTSWIPIVCFILLRNLFATARRYHIELLATLGKVTLETYIAQFHIWMLTTGRNGSPKYLWMLGPSTFPLVNFAVVSVVFFAVSVRLFATTNAIRPLLMPTGAPTAVLVRNGLLATLCGLTTFSAATLVRRFAT